MTAKREARRSREAVSSAHPCQAAIAPTMVAPVTVACHKPDHMPPMSSSRERLNAVMRTVLSRPARRSSGARWASARVKYQDHWKIPFDRTPRVTRWTIVHRFCGMRPRATIVIAAATAAAHIQTVVARSVRGTRGLFIEPPERSRAPGELSPSALWRRRGARRRPRGCRPGATGRRPRVRPRGDAGGGRPAGTRRGPT